MRSYVQQTCETYALYNEEIITISVIINRMYERSRYSFWFKDYKRRFEIYERSWYSSWLKIRNVRTV